VCLWVVWFLFRCSSSCSPSSAFYSFFFCFFFFFCCSSRCGVCVLCWDDSRYAVEVHREAVNNFLQRCIHFVLMHLKHGEFYSLFTVFHTVFDAEQVFYHVPKTSMYPVGFVWVGGVGVFFFFCPHLSLSLSLSLSLLICQPTIHSRNQPPSFPSIIFSISILHRGVLLTRLQAR
jgi:hypothetical protein